MTADEDLQEAWRRRKLAMPLEPKHLEAERAYNTTWREDMSRTSIPLAVRRKAEALAKERGISFPQLVVQLLQLAAANALIDRASHDSILKEHEKKILRLERLHDDLREQANDSVARARKAEEDATATVEELFLMQERLISLLDFMGAPEPDASTFLARTGSDMMTEGGDGKP